MANVLLEVQRFVAETTAELEMSEYIEYLRQLADWASTQADIMEVSGRYRKRRRINGN